MQIQIKTQIQIQIQIQIQTARIDELSGKGREARYLIATGQQSTFNCITMNCALELRSANIALQVLDNAVFERLREENIITQSTCCSYLAASQHTGFTNSQIRIFTFWKQFGNNLE